MLYRRFNDAFGERVALPHGGGTYALFPSPETILELSPDDFCATGMAFKRPGLTAAARAYLTHRAGRQELTPLGLIEALRTIPHVGEWTARAAVAAHPRLGRPPWCDHRWGAPRAGKSTPSAFTKKPAARAAGFRVNVTNRRGQSKLGS